MEISVLRRETPLYVDKNIMGHIYENGKENLVLRFIQKHFIKINLNKILLMKMLQYIQIREIIFPCISPTNSIK